MPLDDAPQPASCPTARSPTCRSRPTAPSWSTRTYFASRRAGSGTAAAPAARSGTRRDGAESPAILGEVGNHLVARDVGGRTRRVPVRPRGRRRAVLGAAGRYGRAPAHRPRRVLRPARLPPTAPASSTSAPATCGCSSRWTPSRSNSTCASAACAPAVTPFPVSAAVRARPLLACARPAASVAAEVRGTTHWLPAEDGPARAVLARARRPRAYPADPARHLHRRVRLRRRRRGRPRHHPRRRRRDPPHPRRGELGRVLELAASPDAKTLAVATDDGRLLTVDLATGAATEIARSTHARSRA